MLATKTHDRRRPGRRVRRRHSKQRGQRVRTTKRCRNLKSKHKLFFYTILAPFLPDSGLKSWQPLPGSSNPLFIFDTKCVLGKPLPIRAAVAHFVLEQTRG